MTFSGSFSVRIDQIWVNREKRQRSKIVSAGLAQSIRKRGIINPLIVRQLSPEDEPYSRGLGFELIAGERRLRAADTIGLPEVPVRLFKSLNKIEAYEIELEENLQREELIWQDRVKALETLHVMWRNLHESWTAEQTAERLNLTGATVSQCLRVATAMHDPRIAGCNSYRAADEILSRRNQRAIDDAVSDIMDVAQEMNQPRQALALGQTSGPGPSPGLDPAPLPSLVLPAPSPVLLKSFLDWAPSYSGPKFNLLHCDFPYGIDAFSGGVGAQHSKVGYADTREIYIQLIECLGANISKLMSNSAHVIFWFSMGQYSLTLEKLKTCVPSIVWEDFPLIWHKSDNVGMVPDPNRSPRRTYETALLGSIGDRKIIKPVANSYAAPTDKSIHPSTKPIPMLKHFFQMFVDNGTKLLDPTCGSGSALRAANSLGAMLTQGLEIDPEYYAAANHAIKYDHILRKGK